MNISISGYGKMGKEVERQAIANGHNVGILPLDPIFEPTQLEGCEVIIDFSGQSIAQSIWDLAIENGVSVVSGTTGFSFDSGALNRRAAANGCAVCWASNFSPGMQLAFQVNRYMARLMGDFPEWVPSVSEVHHERKVDAPSGTAITLAEQIANLHPGVTGWSMEPDEVPRNEHLRIESIREGDVKGIHQVIYSGPYDSISLRHEAFSRGGFAYGAVLAAERLKGKIGYFSFEEILGFE